MTNSIHPTAIITGDVTLGSRNVIGAFVTITGPATLGDDNWIGAGVVIGAPPEVRGFEHPALGAMSEGAGVIIGSRNVIREYAQVHQGWKETTRIGDDAFIMNQVYVAHDCSLGNGVTLASSVLLAGHVSLGEKANLGLGASVHQRVRIGAGSMIGMGAVVVRDIPPFAKAFGNPARTRGVNRIGMERNGVSADAIDAVAVAYRVAPADLTTLAADPELAEHFEGWA